MTTDAGGIPNQRSSAKSPVVGVLRKVLRMLEVMRSSAVPLHLREICEHTGINKTTAYRFLTHLVHEGYLLKDEAGRYSFGMKLLLLGAHVDPRGKLQETARPSLRRLWEITGETVNLAVLDGAEVLYLDVIESPHVFRLASQSGMRRAVYSTALGKSLAAFLPQDQCNGILVQQSLESLTPRTIRTRARLEADLERVRRQGYALDDEESVLGARCVGAPVLDGLDHAVAAVSVSGPTTRMKRERIPEIVQHLTGACRDIARRMSF